MIPRLGTHGQVRVGWVLWQGGVPAPACCWKGSALAHLRVMAVEPCSCFSTEHRSPLLWSTRVWICVCVGQGETLCFCSLGFLLETAAAIAVCVKYAQWRYVSGQNVGKSVKSSRELWFTVRRTHHLPDIHQALQASGSSSSYMSICCHAFLRRLSQREPAWVAMRASSCLGGAGLKQLPRFT